MEIINLTFKDQTFFVLAINQMERIPHCRTIIKTFRNPNKIYCEGYSSFETLMDCKVYIVLCLNRLNQIQKFNRLEFNHSLYKLLLFYNYELA